MAITTQDNTTSASGTESETTHIGTNSSHANNNNNSKKAHKSRRKKKKAPASTTTNGQTEAEPKEDQEVQAIHSFFNETLSSFSFDGRPSHRYKVA
jgi:hypothetical protein